MPNNRDPKATASRKKIGIIFPPRNAGGVFQYALSIADSLVGHARDFDYAVIHYDGHKPELGYDGDGRTDYIRIPGPDGLGVMTRTLHVTVTLGTNKVIRAWEEALLGMRVGGRRRLVTPPNLAYGSRGAGDDIPPNAVLVFEMQVMSIL